MFDDAQAFFRRLPGSFYGKYFPESPKPFTPTWLIHSAMGPASLRTSPQHIRRSSFVASQALFYHLFIVGAFLNASI